MKKNSSSPQKIIISLGVLLGNSGGINGNAINSNSGGVFSNLLKTLLLNYLCLIVLARYKCKGKYYQDCKKNLLHSKLYFNSYYYFWQIYKNVFKKTNLPEKSYSSSRLLLNSSYKIYNTKKVHPTAQTDNNIFNNK